MKKRLMKYICVLVTLLLCVSLFPIVSFAAPDSQEGPTGEVNIVLVVDCSGSTESSDPKSYCLNMANMLLDNAILAETKIGIVTFGYPGGDNPYSPIKGIDSESIDPQTYNFQPLTARSTLSEKDIQNIKDKLKIAVESGRRVPQGKSKTHISYAMEAAYQMLDKAKTPEGKGCIVLLTDGVNTSDGLPGDHAQNMVERGREAGERGWNVFTLFTDWGEASRVNTKIRFSPYVYIPMPREAAGGESFYRLFTTYDDNSKAQINQFFTDILKQYFPITPITIDHNRATIPVDDFVAEMNVTVQDKGVTGIKLYKPDGTPVNVEAEKGRVIISTEKEAYVHAKFICPEPGDWVVEVEGSLSEPKGFCCSMTGYNMELHPLFDASKMLYHDSSSTAKFQVSFSYCGFQYKGREEFSEKTSTCITPN